MKMRLTTKLLVMSFLISLVGCDSFSEAKAVEQKQTETFIPHGTTEAKMEISSKSTQESKANGNQESVTENASSTKTAADLDTLYPVEKADSNPDLRKFSGKQISITTGETVFIVDLYDNSAANDLLTKLPLSFEVSDYSWPEKLLYLNNEDALSMDDYTGGDEPWIPELGYYEPGNWIAMYFGYIGYWSGKIPLGRIEAACEKIESIPAGTTAVLDIYEQK